MRRTAIHLDDVAELGHLAWAFWRAALGKRDRAEVRAFAARSGDELTRLAEQIRAGTVAVGRFRRFVIHDPKRRTIHAPHFRERVLHHALMAHVEPVIERYLIDDTFACRPRKGAQAAAARAQVHARRWPWYLKLDMASYFASIDHDILVAQIRRRIKGRGVLELIERIVRSHRGTEGRGLPIGALTSQHFANLYLAPFDRYLLEQARIGGLARYMDDVVIWDSSRERLRQLVEDSRQWLREQLKLELRPGWQLQRSSRGLTFCGFRVWPDRLGVSLRRRRRYRAARRRWEGAFVAGRIDAFELQRGAAACLSILDGADTLPFRRRDLRLRPAPEA